MSQALMTLSMVFAILVMALVLKFFHESHILTKLLSLEAIMLVNFTFMLLLSTSELHTIGLSFVSFSVMEACIGLSAMIQLTRLSSSSMTSIIYTLKLT